MFTHNLIGEMVGVVLGKHKPRECIHLCQRDFLMERLTVSDNDEREDIEMKVGIPSRMYTDFCEKLTKMIFPEERKSPTIDVNVLNHNSFSSKGFVNVFIEHILHTDLSEKLFNSYVGSKSMPMSVLDFILKNDLLVFAEQVIVNIERLLMSNTQVSGDSICTVMCKLPSLLNTLFDSGRAKPNSRCFKSYGSFSYPLHVASSENLMESVDCLLRHGAELNKTDSKGQTALHCAASAGHCRLIRELLNSMADVNAKDRNGDSALQCAAMNGHKDAMQMLIKGGADVGSTNYKNGTALHYAAKEGHCDVIQELLNSMADVNAKNSDGETPIQLAAGTGHNDSVKMLIKGGADLNIVNNEQCTALHWAAHEGHCDVIEELLNSKADANAKNSDGETPLHWAAMKGHTDIVKILIKGGADLNSINNEHYTALHWVKPRLSGHLRSRENFRINEVSVYMNHDLFAHVLYVEC